MRAIVLMMMAVLPVGVAADWPQFRGPGSAGVSAERNLPTDLSPGKELWKTPVPAGHSSPIVAGDKIFLTGHDGAKIFLIALDRASGKEAWRREVPRPRMQELHKSNSPTSSTPTSDGKNVYAFFVDYGLVSYTHDGKERWKMPLGPFKDTFGQSASPILSGDILLQNCDAESGSFFLAVHKDTGKVKWRVERPEYTRGFSTPVLYKPKDGPQQVLIAGSYQLTAYQVETGEPVWWARGLTWQLKPTPVMDEENIYILGWAGEADPGQQEEVPSFEATLKQYDKDGDGRLSKAEMASNEKIVKAWDGLDLDFDGTLGERDWKLYQAKRAVVNAVRAVKLGGRGDMTHNTLWTYSKSLPNVPSPLLYQGVLYLMKESGILTTLDPKTGAVLKQGRLPGMQEPFFSSPVGADGKVYVMSEGGKLAVLKASGTDWEVESMHDFDDPAYATPAIVDGRIYVRTRSALYAFGKK
jgi:outer membrane protein assembly factor BamB